MYMRLREQVTQNIFTKCTEGAISFFYVCFLLRENL